MSGRGLAWTGLAGGAGVLVAVATLLSETLQPTREIVRYAEDTAESIDAISENVAGGAHLLDTRELALAVPALAQRLLGEAP